jgi:hypothetical protein
MCGGVLLPFTLRHVGAGSHTSEFYIENPEIV